ncbi:restriction endonuclease subunit S [Oleiagrimonas soli]|uniref:Type I restriction enzyme S subunit n=1 Tax=Oleiagrimonas soli TaxID=1543381 RepID=A0A099CUH7_9GAMM|nr:restriction endonuclease subunit S [Oleiagrimonas soli]KGI77346.1 hypothetical protein LF63_0110730 [Oleiagrimonas soli]MBB6182737.1 type I restriction enzyme S subunit [Oleiagrimonas soli]
MNLAVYPKHNSFKPSGFDWIGDVPVHWDVEKIGSMLTAVSEKNHPDLPLLSITREQGVIERDVDDQESNHNFIPDDLSGYKLLRKGQFGMNKMKAWQGSYGVSAHTGIVSPAYFIFDFVREVDPHFFNIAIRSKLYVSYFGSASDGVRVGQWDLNPARMRQIPILLPQLPEQRAIASFLDDKCAKIDEAVRIKEEQIKLLRERRQILIQQAVTRGLNPDAPMKDSGIDWIDQIPAHWEVRRCKYLFREVNERSEEGTEELLSVSHTTGVTARSDKNVYMFMAEDYTGSKLCRPGDIVINTMWAWMGALGVSDFTGIVSPSYGVYRPLRKDAFNRRFLEWLMRTTPFIEQYNKISTGLHSSRLRLYPHMFLRLPMAFPIRGEQDEIVMHVEEKAGKIEQAISIKESQITTLKEYKTTLINAAVTGKIKVI